MKKQTGFSLLEVMLALVVMGYVGIKVPEMYAAANREPKEQAAATQMQRFVKGLQSYRRNNEAAILAAATAITPATITVPMMVATGDLPAGFSATNSYGATLQGQFLQPVAGALTGVAMAVGGNDPGELEAGTIAAKLGAKGGRMTAAGNATGAYGGWSLAMANFTDPGTNRPVAYLDMDTSAGSSTDTDALRRHSVAGHPEYNRMFTAVDMNNKDINNGNNVNAQKVILPNGNSLEIGSSKYYGDGTNSAVRQSGGFLVQNQAGTANRFVVDSSGNTSNPGSSTVSGTVTSQSFIDANNTSYYVNPGSTSRTNYTIQDNNLTYGWNQANIFYDRVNNAYYLQPRGTNRLNYVVADRTYTYGDGNVDDMYIRAAGKWASQLAGGGAYGYAWKTFGGGYWWVVNNPKTGGLSCPPGFVGVGGLTGQAWMYKEWDATLTWVTCV